MGNLKNAKDFGGAAVFFIVISLFIFLGVAILYGMAEMSVWALDWAASIFGVAFLICAFVFLPLAAIPATRGFAGNALYISSYVFGAILWVLSMAFVYIEWGLFPVILGLILGGIGVVPIAFLATIVEGQWSILGNLVALLFLTFGLRAFGFWLIEKAADRAIRIAAERANADQKIPAHRLD